MKSLGIDVGTTSISCVVTDPAGGGPVQSWTEKNTAGILESSYLQDPDHIVKIVRGMMKCAFDKHPDVASIGLTGQMHGIVYIDQHGRAVSPLYTWQDARADEPYQEGRSFCEYLSDVAGYPTAAGYGFATHFVLQERGGLPVDAACFCTIGDYLGLCLTGRRMPVIHASNAASLGMFDLKRCGFDWKAIGKAGIKVSPCPKEVLQKGDVPEKSLFSKDGFLEPAYSGADIIYLPRVTDRFELLGYYQEDIPVSIALGDNQASFLGAVGDPEHDILVNVGTGSQISCCRDTVATHPSVETRPYLEGNYLWVACGLCGGRAYALLERFFEAVFSMAGVCPPDSGEMYTAMENAVARATYGHFGQVSCDRMPLVETTFCGTREDKSKTGGIFGLTEHNFTPGYLVEGFLSGILDELAPGFESFGGADAFERMIGAGNGMRKNTILQNLANERFGLPLKLAPYDEEAALGAALFSQNAVSNATK